jgi:hypothetical protein
MDIQTNAHKPTGIPKVQLESLKRPLSQIAKTVTQSDAQPHIIREWLSRADGQRTEQDIIQFYSYLERAHHDLLAFAANANRPRILKEMLHHFMEH